MTFLTMGSVRYFSSTDWFVSGHVLQLFLLRIHTAILPLGPIFNFEIIWATAKWSQMKVLRLWPAILTRCQNMSKLMSTNIKSVVQLAPGPQQFRSVLNQTIEELTTLTKLHHKIQTAVVLMSSVLTLRLQAFFERCGLKASVEAVLISFLLCVKYGKLFGKMLLLCKLPVEIQKHGHNFSN